ncbi:MAG: tRNA uridine-5-carboxymethylaminomethyl(34) synthesis GTPase MnmE, partial [Thermoprotei archaeon]
EIKNSIIDFALKGKNPDTFSAVVPNLRHKIILEKCLHLALSAAQVFSSEKPLELASVDIRESISLLEEIIGINPAEDMLDQIFSRFCVGK